ncbi:MAG: thiol:disulfide interchange protein [Alphaproteobacteria bacterium]|nr:thiol:disulfide interchange protein [Alphaproteobacteria bacterium]
MLKKILAAFAFCLLVHPAYAQLSLNPDQEKKVKATLIAENDGVKAGDIFWVAMRQEITPGWHTYWKNPGDTGLATSISWDLPQGFTAGELQFPTPHRQPTGELVNFGYTDSVMLLSQITAPGDLKTGETLHIKAKGSWLVCADICIPETEEFDLALKVANKPVTGPWASAFIAARAKLPMTNSSRQAARVTAEEIEITLDPLPLNADELPEEALFFPDDGLLIQHNAVQKLALNGRALTLTIPRNKSRTTPVTEVSGDLMLRNAMGEKSFRFTAKVEIPPVLAPAQTTVIPPVSQKLDDHTPEWHQRMQDGLKKKSEYPPQTKDGFFSAIFAAFLGGILLNLMPCVFPVLSLKALGLVKKAHDEKRRAVIMGGVAYLAGVLATFTLLGAVLITLKNAGAQIGWGVQLQSPAFVAAIALVLFAIAYSLSGAVTFGTRLMGVGNALTQKSSLAGSFFTGALAVVVATPCTAPFMGGAIFYALTQRPGVTLAVLWVLGFGLALPYLLLTIFPEILLKYLPRPGVWMEHFKEFLAFPMLAAAIWLTWVLAQQSGATGVLYVLLSMLSLGFGAWLWGTTQNRPVSWWQYSKIILALVAMVAAVALVIAQPKNVPQQNTSVETGAVFEAYTPEKLAQYRAEKRPVFVNMTAAWCITCLANEKAALETRGVETFFHDNKIAFLKGDWTNYDDRITSYLKEFGRSGVPIYVFYPADQSNKPVILPQILTPDVVINAIKPLIGETNE